MYDLNFYDRHTRHLLAGSTQLEDLPEGDAVWWRNRGDLAEARKVSDWRDVRHWNGERWVPGELPGKVNEMRR